MFQKHIFDILLLLLIECILVYVHVTMKNGLPGFLKVIGVVVIQRNLLEN